MSKRPAIDLSSLTSESAAPMAEASQRTAVAPPVPAAVPAPAVQAPSPAAARPSRAIPEAAIPPERTRTENLQPLAFKVPPAFRKRFRQHAANADLKLNELLFAALEAWEEKNKVGK